MSDGRIIIDDTYKVIKGISEELESKKANFSEDAFAKLAEDVDASLTWAKKCRNKVWLRSLEGTDLATGCFEAANKLKEDLDGGKANADAASGLLNKLDALARIIATKASVMT